MTTPLIDLRPDDVVVIDGEELVFERRLPPPHHAPAGSPDVYQFKDRYDYKPKLLGIPEFERLYADRKVIFKSPNEPPGPLIATSDVSPQCAARRRFERYILQQYDDKPVPLSDRKLREFIAVAVASAPFSCEWIPSPGTVRRLIRKRGRPGDRPLLQMGHRSRAFPESTLDARVQEVLLAECEKYWQNRRINKRDVWVATFDAITSYNDHTGSNLQVPSVSTVWRHLQRQHTFENVCARDGRRVADSRFRPIAGSLKADQILEKAIIDHTPIDCFVVDDEYGLPLGRPTLTIMMDVRSRYVLGYYLGFEPPSNHALVACLENALRPKLDLRSRFESVTRDWIAYGLPSSILVDNGLEFTGTCFTDACGDLGISVEWAPVRTPQNKGIIERFFGTLNAGLFHKLPGGVPHKPHKMKELEIDAAANASLRLSEVEELLVKFLVDVYSIQPHSTLKTSPEQAWRERAKVDRIRLARNLALLEPSLGNVVRDVTLSRKGITHDNLTYCSDVVFDLLNDLLPLSTVKGQRSGTVKVKIKVRPDDVGNIFVFNHKRSQYVRIPCTNPEYASGLSSHQHKKIQEWAISRGQGIASERDLCRAKTELRAQIESFVPRKMLHRKQHQRLKTVPILSGDHITVLQTPDSALCMQEFELPVETLSARLDPHVEKARRSRRKKQSPSRPVVVERKTVGDVDLASLMDNAMQEAQS